MQIIYVLRIVMCIRTTQCQHRIVYFFEV